MNSKVVMNVVNPPLRVLNRRARDIPAGAVYVGRPSMFGNPFEIGRDGDRDAVCNKYEDFIASRPDLQQAAREQLKGKHLICWCAPHRCHAQTLIRIANEESP